MSTTLGGLIGGIKRAVIDAQRSVSQQHIEELQQFFVPAADQDASAKFPDGKWSARTVAMNVPREVSRNGVVSLENHTVHVPLIALLPMKSYLIERVEILTTLDLALAELDEDAKEGKSDLPPEVRVNLGDRGLNTAEIKIVIEGQDPPGGYARVVHAYEKLLNSQLPT